MTLVTTPLMIYPPRAKVRIREDKIVEYADKWWAQCKFNGTALIIFCFGGRLTIMNRHGKIYAINIDEAEILSIFPKSKDWIVCGEYMNKAKNDETGHPLRDKFIIWDITNFDGDDLIGMMFKDRIGLLLKNVKRGKKSTRPYIEKELTDNIFIARTFQTQIENVFKLSWIDMIEGIVLKRSDAPLKPCTRPDNNIEWQVKVRKGTKCYKF